MIGEWGQVIPICFPIFLLVWIMLGCMPKINFLTCLEVPTKFLWVVVGLWLDSKFSDRLWLELSLDQAGQKPIQVSLNNIKCVCDFRSAFSTLKWAY